MLADGVVPFTCFVNHTSLMCTQPVCFFFLVKACVSFASLACEFSGVIQSDEYPDMLVILRSASLKLGST